MTVDEAGPVGFIGLGNMGAVLAANLVDVGHPVVCHDIAGPDRMPSGAEFAPDVDTVTARASIVVLSLPDGRAGEDVVRQIVDAEPRRTHVVVDTSTVGPAAARTVAALLSAAGIALVDAPVSGGVAGARARTLTVMVAGSPEARRIVAPVIAGLSDRHVVVGDEPGMAQAVKLANNFLSASALAAASEAVAFGLSAGVDMGTLLEVINASSGQSMATLDKFPNHVLTGTYASGFANTLMAKDVRLYLQAAAAEGGPAQVGSLIAGIWDRFAVADPGVDFTRIFPYLAGGGAGGRAEDGGASGTT